jgi:hypothetical protein
MHPGLALVDGDFRFEVSPIDVEPNLHWYCPSSGTGSTMLTSSFTGTTRDDNVCST